MMTVMTKSTPGALLLRRRRDGRPGRVAEPARIAEPGRIAESGRLPETHQGHRAAPIADPTSCGSGALSAAHPRRRLDVPQDHATYACRCGYVFEAAVSTSVGCPHCGDAQAW